MGSILRIAIALLPLSFAPVIVYLIASGYFDLGGGEKDLVVVLPWLLWSFILPSPHLFFGAAAGQLFGQACSRPLLAWQAYLSQPYS
ncbi:MAG TPA: hypothetical protein VMM84_18535 [Pyrinomonadaceae bacterium]|nr:hypothetical protein [Pyrinomonadaceae bacterium]